MHHPIHRITHTTALVTPVVEHWLERRVLKEGHILFNDALNTFYLLLYGVSRVMKTKDIDL